MMKRTHLAVGLAATIPLIVANPISVIGLLGSTVPDWDYYIGLEHRGFTHSFLALGLSTWAIYVVDSRVALVWFINYLLHIMLDSLTVMGVPFLYPLIKQRCYLAKLKTRGGEDYFFQLMAIAFICFRYLE